MSGDDLGLRCSVRAYHMEPFRICSNEFKRSWGLSFACQILLGCQVAQTTRQAFHTTSVNASRHSDLKNCTARFAHAGSLANAVLSRDTLEERPCLVTLSRNLNPAPSKPSVIASGESYRMLRSGQWHVTPLATCSRLEMLSRAGLKLPNTSSFRFATLHVFLAPPAWQLRICFRGFDCASLHCSFRSALKTLTSKRASERERARARESERERGERERERHDRPTRPLFRETPTKHPGNMSEQTSGDLEMPRWGFFSSFKVWEPFFVPILRVPLTLATFTSRLWAFLLRVLGM